MEEKAESRAIGNRQSAVGENPKAGQSAIGNRQSGQTQTPNGRTAERPNGRTAERPNGRTPVILIALHVLFCVLYNLHTPFGNNGYANTPDEGAHFQYVKYVAQAWRLPVFQGYEGVGYESHQPPLYYFLAAVVYRLSAGSSEPGKGVRGVSTLCTALTVLLTWWIARRLRKESSAWVIGVTAFVAFLPMFIAIGSAVGNDALIVLIFTAFLATTLRWLEQPSLKQAALMGLLIGLGLLTKTTAVLLLPIALFALYLGLREQYTMKSGIQTGAAIFVIALAIGGWWFVRNAILYHDPLLQKTFIQAFSGTAKAEDLMNAFNLSGSDYLLWVGNWTFRSFWFAYGIPETANTGKPNFLPDWIYLVLGFWQLVVLVGLGFRLRQPVAPPFQNWLKGAALTFALVALTFLAFIRIFFQAQGRYFFPALAPIAIFNLMGWEGLFPERFRQGVHWILVVVWFLFALWVGWSVLS